MSSSVKAARLLASFSGFIKKVSFNSRQLRFDQRMFSTVVDRMHDTLQIDLEGWSVRA